MSEIKELIKLAVDSMKNQTYYELIKNDMEYQKSSDEVRKALQAVDELNLTHEQRMTVNTLIAKKDEEEYDCRTNMYMAGMIDAYEILRQFNLTKE